MAAPSAAASGGMEGAPGAEHAARNKLEEAIGKLNISEEEATPLILDDHVEGAPARWLVAGKILHRNLFHIQTITNALRPAWVTQGS